MVWCLKWPSVCGQNFCYNPFVAWLLHGDQLVSRSFQKNCDWSNHRKNHSMKSMLVVKSPYCFLNPNLSHFLNQFDSNQPYVPYSAKRTSQVSQSYIMLPKIAKSVNLYNVTKNCHIFCPRLPFFWGGAKSFPLAAGTPAAAARNPGPPQ